jgi:hypothetical protein
MLQHSMLICSCTPRLNIVVLCILIASALLFDQYCLNVIPAVCSGYSTKSPGNGIITLAIVYLFDSTSASVTTCTLGNEFVLAVLAAVVSLSCKYNAQSRCTQRAANQSLRASVSCVRRTSK